MKTQLIAFVTLLASSPAVASINSSEVTPMDIAPQPAAYRSQTASQLEPHCGDTRQMMFILRDPSGAIVAMGVAEVPAPC